MPLRVELCAEGGDIWVPVGNAITRADLPGSFSYYVDGERQVAVFECLGASSRIRRSMLGVDLADDDVRLVQSLELQPLAWLGARRAGERKDVFEMNVSLRPDGQRAKVRFTHVDDQPNPKES